jgi:molybdate transport system substrate-binding protein
MIFMIEFKHFWLKIFSSFRNLLIRGIFLGWLGLLSGVVLPAYAQDESLKIGVAANLLLPMQKIKQLYEEKFGSTLVLIPGSSGKLTAQILNGAPYDIFLSADMKFPARIQKEGHASTSPQVLLRGRLAFWSKEKPDQPLQEWLRQSEIRSVALAQPELAPYGQRAKDWLQEQGLYDHLLPKVIFGESIGQVNQYIRSGTVEAAFTAISAMHADALRNQGYWQALDIKSGDPSRLDHGMVLLTNATGEQRTIDQFVEFILSPIAEKVFLEFGYETP